MDFHSMVSRFKQSVLEEEQQVTELSKNARKIVRKYIADGTPDRHTPKYSFKELFRDVPNFDRLGKSGPMRVMFPMGNTIQRGGTELFKRLVDQGWEPAFTTKTVIQKNRDEDGREYDVPMVLPVLEMKKEEEKVIPKGPRAGEKVTSTKKVSLGKLIQRMGSDEDKAWWKENQNDLREMENVRKFFLKPYLNDFDGLTRTPNHIIISRHPIDVARMSDFSTTRSCHSEGSSHFNCAVDESRGHGMVAYLVRGQEVDEYDLKNRLNAEEIFGDNAIDLEGPEPISRVRIYKMFNRETDEEFGVVEDRVYGIAVPDFLPSVRRWMREKQKDMWADEEGNFKEGFLSPSEWIRVGGEYADQEQGGGQIGDLVLALFEDTPFYESLIDDYERVAYDHEDYYGEAIGDVESEMENAAERVEEIVRVANTDRTGQGKGLVSIYGDVEEGWDEMPFYVQGGGSVEFSFEFGDDWEDKEGRTMVPEESSDYGAQREFEELIHTALYDYGIYFNSDYNIRAEETDIPDSTKGARIRVMLDVTFGVERTGTPGVDDFDSSVDEFKQDFDVNYNSAYGIVRRALIAEEYLPPGKFEKAVEKYYGDDFKAGKEFKNLAVMYDENDPGDGIDIALNIPREKLMLVPAKPGFYELEPRPASDSQGRNVYTTFTRGMELNADNLSASLRREFKKLANEGFKAANQQVPLPFDTEFKRKPMDMRRLMPYSFDTGFATQIIPSREIAGASGEEFRVGFNIRFKLSPRTIESAVFEHTEAFLDYLDKHIDVLYQAAERAIDRLYDRSADAVQRAAAAREKSELREIAQSLIMEQEAFETRLYQVNLKIQVDRDTGGGIEQKLNRIRAIEGVTVVGHDDLSQGRARQVIEARIKFHPDSDSTRPETFVRQVLVPEINSSKLVPGVRVIDIVSGSLKRLDK